MIGASSGVEQAQGKVLLYGVSTDLTVTTAPKPPSNSQNGSQRFQITAGPRISGVSGQENGAATGTPGLRGSPTPVRQHDRMLGHPGSSVV